VGRLNKAHGLKGGLKLELFTDDPDRRFARGATFTLQVPDSSPWADKSITLDELRWYNGHPVAFFEGIADRTAAETLVKAILWIDADLDEATGEDDAWYDHQLVGLTVLRDGVSVGTVARVDHLPAQDLLAVETPDRGEVLVPFVGAIVPAVDIAGGTLTVTPPTGLFEDPVESEPAADPAASDATTSDAASPEAASSDEG
jgi:16S rRNA processing protein RimM